MYYICKKLRNGRVETLAMYRTIDEARKVLREMASENPKAFIRYGEHIATAAVQ